MFDKIKTTINNKFNGVKDKINTLKEENELYQKLLDTSTTLQDFQPNQKTNQEITEYIVHYIHTTCPDINTDKATIIAHLIPITETLLEVYYAKEILTNNEYFIIPTNYRLWIISTQNYKILSLDNNQISIIKNNLMSKVLLLNNVLLEVNGTTEKINKLINILNNPTIRQNIIQEETNYLCGIIPTYQKINSLKSGISIDKDKNIVIHSKENNYKLHISGITNYEILLDNQIHYSKNSNSKTTITNFNTSCFKISIRFTTQDNTQIIIPILEPNNFGTKYQSHDTIFQTNLTYATELIKILESLQTK